MTPRTNQTVRDIVVENPAAVKVFESLGIDYCCGGKLPFEEACARANVPIARAIELLAQAPPSGDSETARDWADASIAEITAHVVSRHHGYVRRESPRLQGLLEKVDGRHGPAHPEIASIKDLFSALIQELFAHMMKEERILFPYLESLDASRNGGVVPSACFGSVRNPIENMLADHDDAGELLARMRALSGGYQAPAGACSTYLALYQGLEEFERDLHRHIHLENNILFPRAVEMEQSLQAVACERP